VTFFTTLSSKLIGFFSLRLIHSPYCSTMSKVLTFGHLNFNACTVCRLFHCCATAGDLYPLTPVTHKSIHGANSISVHHLQQPMRHTRQRGTHTFTPLSSRTNVYKYSYFPRTVVDWNALPDSAHSAPSTDSFRAALHRLSTSPSNSHC